MRGATRDSLGILSCDSKAWLHARLSNSQRRMTAKEHGHAFYKGVYKNVKCPPQAASSGRGKEMQPRDTQQRASHIQNTAFLKLGADTHISEYLIS